MKYTIVSQRTEEGDLFSIQNGKGEVWLRTPGNKYSIAFTYDIAHAFHLLSVANQWRIIFESC